MDTSEIGRRVQIARVWAGHSKRDTFLPIAEAGGISPRQLGQIENGKREPTLLERQALSEMTGVPEQFFTDPQWASLTESPLDRMERHLHIVLGPINKGDQQ